MPYYIHENRLHLAISNLIQKAGYDGMPSFSDGLFAEEEHYKYDVYENARKILDFQSWSESDIGSGRILSCARSAVEANGNLVNFRNKHIEDADLEQTEKVLYQLYCTENDEKSFNEILRVISRKTDLISYLFFLKNKDKYLPFRPRKFEIRLALMGIPTSCTDYLCWSNYQEFLEIVTAVRSRIQPYFKEQVTLLDAHSFVWMQWLLKEEYLKMEPLRFDYSFGIVRINKEQWIRVIEDGTITEKDIDYLLKFHAAPHHASTMKRLGTLEGKNPSSYLSPCTSIAKRVQKKLNVDDINWSNGQFRYFPICFLGRYDFNGNFEWQLRPELTEALEEEFPFKVGRQIEQMYRLEAKEASGIPVNKLIAEACEIHEGPAPVFTTTTTQRRRNAKLVRAAKALAGGICQLCGSSLDFKDSDGWPYLEVHHIIPLADDGPDDLANMVALCPNCHTRMHVVGDQKDIEKLKAGTKVLRTEKHR